MKTKLFFALILIALLVAPLWAKGPNGPSTSPGLTDLEKANILYLFEEEKLAHEVYVKMYEEWGANIFDIISQSEERHMNSVENLIYKYGLDDTVVTNGSEVFTNDVLGGKYIDLRDEGYKGLKSALEVGVKIEEMDIDDIERMLEKTDKPDITRVLNNLLDGSNNHLDAFETHLQ